MTQSSKWNRIGLCSLILLSGCIDSEQESLTKRTTDNVKTDLPDDSHMAEAKAIGLDKGDLAGMGPEEALIELKQKKDPDAFLEFVEANPGNKVALSAIRFSLRNFSADSEFQKAIGLKLRESFVLNPEVDLELAWDAAKLMLGIATLDQKIAYESLLERFLKNIDHLDRSSVQVMVKIFSQADGEIKWRAVELLGNKFADDPRIPSLVGKLSRAMPDRYINGLLELVVEKSSDKEIRGKSLYALASFYSRTIELRSFFGTGEPDQIKDKDNLEFIKNFDAEKHSQKIESIYRTLVRDFDDVECRRGQSLADMATDQLYVLRYLSVGKTAPEIVGEDLDGEAFRLSDYRGKVVMLDFWGDW
ncbi:MAG: hypothetical protein AAGA30_07535 [Planctomycetota bacterium]